MESRFWFTSRLDFSQTNTLIPVLACGYGSRASNEALQKRSCGFDVWKSSFARISKTTCDVSLVFASSSDMKCKFVSSNLPQGFSCLILNFPRTRHTKEPL